MGSSKMETALAGVNDIKNELSAYEVRLGFIRTEVDSLKRQKEQLKGEAEAFKVAFNADIDAKRRAFSEEKAKFSEESDKLKAQRAEFEEILLTFKREKNEFEKERSAVADLKADAKKTMDRVGQFLSVVREASGKL